eukprot:g3440.t1
MTNPALVSAGPGVTLGFAEARRKGPDQDHIDIVMRRSTDGGSSWDRQTVLAGDTHGPYSTAYNNIVPIAEPGRGLTHVVFCVNNTWVFHTKSSDAGRTWTTPRNISSMVVRPGWGWMATGPGHGIVTSTGRLVVGFNTFLADADLRITVKQTGCAATRECAVYRPAQEKSLHTNFTIVNTADPSDPPLYGSRPLPLPTYVAAGDRSGVLISDDSGDTWRIGAQVRDRIGSSECSPVEVPGALLLSFRVEDKDSGCRKFSRSNDMGGGTDFEPYYEPAGCIPDPVCEGSTLSLGNGTVVLTSGPGSSDSPRTDVAIYASRDQGRSFKPLRRFALGRLNTGYTDLVLLGGSDGRGGDEKLVQSARRPAAGGAWNVGVAYGADAGVGFEIFSVPFEDEE